MDLTTLLRRSLVPGNYLETIFFIRVSSVVPYDDASSGSAIREDAVSGTRLTGVASSFLLVQRAPKRIHIH